MTFIGALWAALAVAGRPAWEYSDLMGFSGMAFRLRWHPDACPSAAVAEFQEESDAIARCAGQRLAVAEQWKQEKPDRGPLRARIVASIDAGKPVIAYCSCLDLGLIVGYQQNGDVLLTHDYHKAETPASLPLDKLGPMQFFLEEPGTPLPPRERLAEALKLAVLHARRGTLETLGRKYFYGDRALQAWIEALRAPKPADQVHHTTGFNYSTLLDCRRAAVTFLTHNSRHFGEAARGELDKAIDAYRQELDFLKANLELFKTPLPKWDAAVREKQAAALEALRPLDAAPVTRLEAALLLEKQ